MEELRSTYGFDFNSRELAVLTLIAAAACFLLVTSGGRQSLRGLGGVLKAFLQWKVYVPMLTLFVWVGIVLLGAERLGLWHLSDSRASLQWCLTSGFILMVNLNEVKEGYLWNSVRQLAGFTAIIEFAVNLEPLSYWWELVLQLFGLVIVVAPIITKGKEQAEWRVLSPKLLRGIFILIVVHTALVFQSKGFHYDLVTPVQATLLQIGLTLAALPFVAGFAVIAGYESAFTRLGFANNDRRPSLAVRAGFASVLGWRLKYIAAAKSGTFHIARATSFTGARTATLEWRAQLDAAEAAILQAQRDLIAFAGSNAVDEEGRRRDKREFKATCKTLDWLASCMHGSYDHAPAGRYKHLLTRPGFDFQVAGVVGDPGIVLVIRTDGQAWYAWRRTASGWCFAIGCVGQEYRIWRCDGPNPPSAFPGQAPEWGTSSFDVSTALNWYGHLA